MDFGFDWKDGFMDNPVDMLTTPSEALAGGNSWNAFPNFDSSFMASTPVASSSGQHKIPRQRNRQRSLPASDASNASAGDLAPTRIRRQYNCDSCSFRTINPREFLYHRRDDHAAKVKIVECPYCVYACQYFQKLQRHILLVHKLETVTTPPTGAGEEEEEEEEESSVSATPSTSKAPPPLKRLPARAPEDDSQDEGSLVVDEGLDDSRDMEPDVEQMKKTAIKLDGPPFKCDTCGYTTNVKPLFRKHVKYHTAPKIKCDKCDFESPYPWNVDRHARSHLADGNFKCHRCAYVCGSNQALQNHITNIHGRDTPDDDYQNDNDDDLDDEDFGSVMPEVSLSEDATAAPTCKATQSLTMRTGAVNIVQYPGQKEAVVKLLHCAYCNFTHKESKSMVSHLSVHTGKKPYKCHWCDFSSNWKEVVARHAKSRHNGSNLDVDQLFKYTVSKFICRVIDEKGELNLTPEVTFAEDLRGRETCNGAAPLEEDIDSVDNDETLASSVQGAGDEKEHSATNNNSATTSTFTRFGLSGFRGEFKCELCPFRAEKAFHIDFHVKRHQPSEGADFKCPHCPYWVNAKKSLVRHIYLHDCENGTAAPPDEYGPALGDTGDDANGGHTSHLEKALSGQAINTGPATFYNKRASAKNACDYCPFVAGTKTQLLYHKQFHRPNRSAPYKCTHCTYSVSHQHLLNQHIKVHYKPVEQAKDDGHGNESDVRASLDTEAEAESLSFAVVGGRRVYQCRYCPASSDKKNLIIVHQQRHEASSSNADVFKCRLCRFMSASRSAFLNHLDGHTVQEEQRDGFGDGLVPRATKKQKVDQPQQTPATKNHAAKLASQFPYVCPGCPATFKSTDDLKIHSVFHNVPYPHSCFYCSYKAKNRQQLSKHLYVHTHEYVSKRSAHHPHATQQMVDSQEILQQREHLMTEERKENEAGPSGKVCGPPPLHLHSLRQIHSNQQRQQPQLHKTDLPLRNIRNQVVPDYDSLNFDIDYTSVDPSNLRPSLVEKINYHIEQLCLIEKAETLEFLNKSKLKIRHNFVNKCPACPASFAKSHTLKFHSSLHGYDGVLRCPKCSYSVDFEDSLQAHGQLHVNPALPQNTTTHISNSTSINPNNGLAYNHRCTRCPAAFSKPSRLEKHLTLHGSGARWKCDKCDYAVPYAATLVKHKHVHEPDAIDFDAVSAMESHPMASAQQQLVPLDQMTEPIKLSTPARTSGGRGGHGDPNTYFCCDRCPYSHPRRDAVQSHQKRHEQERSVRDGKKCSHCDYVCLQPSYLREHMRLHFEPPNDRKARLYRSFEEMELWLTELASQDKKLLFRDTGKDIDVATRFEPHIDDEEFIEFYKSLPSLLSSNVEDEEEIAGPIDEEDDEEQEKIDGNQVINESNVEDEDDDLIDSDDILANMKQELQEDFLEPQAQLEVSGEVEEMEEGDFGEPSSSFASLEQDE